METIVEIMLPPIDVAQAMGVVARMQLVLEALWVDGRLRALVDSPEGKAALGAYEDARTDAERQVKEAAGKGITELRVRVRSPRASAPLAIAFGKRFLTMASDRELMESLGAQPLPADDVRLLEAQLAHAAGVLAGKMSAE